MKELFKAAYRPLCQINPYPESHPAHKRLEKANREAESLLLELAMEDDFDPIHASPGERMKWAMDAVVERFKIRAEAALQVVINQETYEHYVNHFSKDAEDSIESACLMAQTLRRQKSLLKFPVRELRTLLTLLLHNQVTYFRQQALLQLEQLEDSAEEQPASPTLQPADEPPSCETSSPTALPLTPQANRLAVESYIEEVLEKTGKRITKTAIWKLAGYRTRTEFERWERNDPKATKTAHERFSKILAEKPHIKPVK